MRGRRLAHDPLSVALPLTVILAGCTSGTAVAPTAGALTAAPALSATPLLAAATTEPAAQPSVAPILAGAPVIRFSP